MPSADALAVCVDFGSTFTKAALVDLSAGRIVAEASHPTTIETDVLDGYDACLATLADADRRAGEADVLACSSAGGGLRIAVVGNEDLVTAEAQSIWTRRARHAPPRCERNERERSQHRARTLPATDDCNHDRDYDDREDRRA